MAAPASRRSSCTRTRRSRMREGATREAAVQGALDTYIAIEPRQVRVRFRPPLPSHRPARAAPAARWWTQAARAGEVSGRVRGHRARHRSRTGRAQGQDHPDEYRRRDRRDLRGAGLSRASGARPVLPVAFGRHPGACLGTNATGRPQQGADSAVKYIPMYEGHRRRVRCRPKRCARSPRTRPPQAEGSPGRALGTGPRGRSHRKSFQEQQCASNV